MEKQSIASPIGDNDDDNTVVLECFDPNRTETVSDVVEAIVISAADINSWELPSNLTQHVVKVKADRNRLIEHSTYFHALLGGAFCESSLHSVSIQWNLETFLSVFKFMYGCPVDVTPANFLALFEGALFFGLEMLLLKCKIWLTDITSSKTHSSLQLQLDDLIHIWMFGVEHANDFIPDFCTSYLARNFLVATMPYLVSSDVTANLVALLQMRAMCSSSFGNAPCDLLISCIKHPHLTVDSERHLLDAILAWFATETERRNKDNSNKILEEIRFSLLPLWFASGKKRCSYFSRFANKSINAILTLTKLPSTSSIDVLGDGDLHHLRIRLTEFTEKVDLSSCPQLKPVILLLSILPCTYSTDPILRRSINGSMNIICDNHGSDKIQISWGLLPTLTFEAVEEVDISNCPSLHVEAAFEFFCKAFPSLRRFKAAYFLNFKAMKLRQIVERCPLLCDIDLTVDISPVVPMKVSIISSTQAVAPKVSTFPFSVVNCFPVATLSDVSWPLLSNITSLTLEGRIDVTDTDLQNFSEFCVSLCYLNIKGCISATDAGISALILRCIKLRSIVACDTSFGQNSVLALCSGMHNLESSAAPLVVDKHSLSLASKLQTLHLGCCKGVSETHLSELILQARMLYV